MPLGWALFAIFCAAAFGFMTAAEMSAGHDADIQNEAYHSGYAKGWHDGCMWTRDDDLPD